MPAVDDRIFVDNTYFYSMANKLIGEQSPYLLQHAHNPVNWYPWGDEAFAIAKKEHKPVLVSIGYAACHWCHVMEHESFEDEAVAAYMNEHFVCIKVDREEHPDVDHFYMDAVQAIGGHGGWPLNVFATPDRAPFYGGTYFPPRAGYNRPSWTQLLERMNDIWHHQREEVTQQSEQMIRHLEQASRRAVTEKEAKNDPEMSRKIADTLLKMADKEKGGFGAAPKFPGTMAITFLLEHYHYTSYEPALKQALVSLDAMIAGGIYDQAGGGFSRYATDRDWLIPHFEKMLYDNALLVGLLCDAWLLTGDEKYRATADETIAFASRELKDKSGGYYCALDADSEGVEGKFYTWTWDEWTTVFEGENPVAARYFGVSERGNWEGTNILHVTEDMDTISRENGMSVEEASRKVGHTKQKLMEARAGRVRPQTDDKCLLSWNALWNIGLTKAGMTIGLHKDAKTGSESAGKYQEEASAHMGWMLDSFLNDGLLLHTWKNGVAKIPAKLDDYAFLIQALLQLASVSGEEKWVLTASRLVETVIKNFSGDGGFFYYTPEGQQDMPVRKIDVHDGATPSANAIMAWNLWVCGMCMERSEWISRSEQMIGSMQDTAIRYSYSFGYWSVLLQRLAAGMKLMVVSGAGANDEILEIRKKILPHVYCLSLQKEISELPILQKKYFADKLSIFVCSEQACLSPVSSAEAAFHLVSQ